MTGQVLATRDEPHDTLVTAMRKLVSIVCPVYNEEQAIPILYERLQKAIADYRDRFDFELLFTNNASTRCQR